MRVNRPKDCITFQISVLFIGHLAGPSTAAARLKDSGIEPDQGGLGAGCLRVSLHVRRSTPAQNDFGGLDTRGRKDQYHRPIELGQPSCRRRIEPGPKQPVERAATLWPHDLGIVPKPLPMNQRQHIGKAFLGDGGRGGVNGWLEAL